jgi:hypothetical protein
MSSLVGAEVKEHGKYPIEIRKIRQTTGLRI